MPGSWNLDPIFYPKSVAVIGASDVPGKVGTAIVTNLKDLWTGEKIYPINPRKSEILGLKAYKSIKDVPDEVDLAVIAVPAKIVPQVVKECAEKKVKGIIIISAGFSETGEEGAKLEEEIRKIANDNGIPIIGPNCLGVYNSENKLATIFNPPDRQGFPRQGSIAFLSQSGAFGAAVLDWLTQNNIGMSKFVSYGNKCNVYEEDLLEYLADDEITKVITMYVEGVSHGKRFLEVAKKVSMKKPIIVLKSGRSHRGARAASLHTGSLAGSDEVYDGAFKQAGIIRAYSMEQLFNYAKMLSMQPLAKGDRIAVVTNGGGAGVMATDAVETNGLKMAELNEETKKKFKKAIENGIFSRHISYANPVDILGDAPPERYEIAMRYVLEDENVDALVVIIIAQSPAIREDIVDRIALMKSYGKPIAVVIPGGSFAKKIARKLEENNIPTYETPEDAVDALAALIKYSKYRMRCKKSSN
ncbi:MAG: CoA-binding protein [Euryarchaeota archaeon]|nr:CoA-binding protein [Euryarchaeota archaeon]